MSGPASSSRCLRTRNRREHTLDEPLLLSLLKHVPEVVVLGFTILLRIVDADIDRSNGGTIRPEGGDQVDSLHHPVVLPAPMPGDHLHLVGIRFVQGTNVDDQESLL